MQSVITHYNTFIHIGCKVPWALRGGAGYAASAEAYPGIHGRQVVPTTTNSGTDAKVFAAHRANSFTPAGREKSVYSPCLTMYNRNPKGFSQKFDTFFSKDEERKEQWMAFSNVSVEYVPEEKGIVRRMHYASFPSMFRSNLYEALAVGNAPKRCPICRKFFLTTTARRQKYCTGYAPEEYGGMTCGQVGNRMGREHREQANNNPVLVRYHQTVNVIDQRVTRGTLEAEIADKAKADAKNCKDMAIAFNEYANGDYKTDMDADALIAEAMKQ